MLEFENCTKRYGARAAIEDVSFSCKPGSVTALLGPNGAGKTTLLKAAAGIHYPSDGRVLVCGVSVADEPGVARGKTAFIPEVPDFPPGFTVGEYLRYAHSLHRAAQRECATRATTHGWREAVLRAARGFALEDVLQKRIGTLSKGYRQRLSFALALTRSPEVLLLDEPVSGLDPTQIVEMRTLIRETAKTRTVLLSTHLLPEVESVADNIAVLHHGRLVATGTKGDILSRTGTATLEEAYIALTRPEAV